MAKLAFIDKDFAGQTYEFTLEKTTVGRADQNNLVIRDASVSLHHCEILVNGNEVIVCDLDSRNGTFVDGIRVKKQSQVKSEQVVRFGSVAARLKLELPPDNDDATSITAVYALRHFERDEKQAESKPHPPDMPVKLGPASPAASDPRTVILPRTSLPPQTLGPVTPEHSGGALPERRWGTVIVVTAAVVLSLVVLAWLWWGRR